MVPRLVFYTVCEKNPPRARWNSLKDKSFSHSLVFKHAETSDSLLYCCVTNRPSYSLWSCSVSEDVINNNKLSCLSCFHVTWILLHWKFFHLSVEIHMSRNLPQYLEGLCSTCCRQIWRTSFTRSGGSWWKLACRVRSSVWDGSAPRRKYVSTARPFEPPLSDQRAGQQVGVTNRLLGPSKLIRQWQSCFSRAGQSFGWMSVHWSEALDKTVTRVTSRSKLHLLQGEGYPAAFDIKCGVN